MLKKLLASALAVATVASCAYVPTALASAAAPTKTADAIEYAVWKVDHPDQKEDTVDVKVYTAGDAAKPSYDIKGLEISKNNEEGIKAYLADQTDYKDPKGLTKYEITVIAAPTANTYIAQFAKKKMVYYHPYNANAAAPADTTAANTTDKGLVELGWFDVADTNVTAKLYNEGITAKLASYSGDKDTEFSYWNYKSTHLVVPAYRAISNAATWETVDLCYPEASKVEVDRLINGTYALVPNNAQVNQTQKLQVPKNDADWDTYVANFAKLHWNNPLTVGSVTYKFAGVKKVADKKYAAVFTAPASTPADTSQKVTYTLKYDNGTSTPATIGTANVTKSVAEVAYTIKADEVYAIVKDKDDKATLAEYLEAVTGDKGATKYVWDGESYADSTIKNPTGNTWTVDLTIKPVKYTKYTVYSFDTANNVVKGEAYLADSQFEAASGGIAKVKADAVAGLGIEKNARYNGVPMIFTYAAKTVGGKDIATTYEYGVETVAAADFATTEGLFDDVAYFGKAAKAGNVVTLKVSFTEDGALKGLDLSKVSVAFKSETAKQLGDVFTYSVKHAADKDHKDGKAAEFELAAGLNVIQATISYDGKEIKTCAPFYAYVAE